MCCMYVCIWALCIMWAYNSCDMIIIHVWHMIPSYMCVYKTCCMTLIHMCNICNIYVVCKCNCDLFVLNIQHMCCMYACTWALHIMCVNTNICDVSMWFYEWCVWCAYNTCDMTTIHVFDVWLLHMCDLTASKIFDHWRNCVRMRYVHVYIYI